MNNLFEKWVKDPNRPLTGEDVQMANKPMKRCSTSQSSGERSLKQDKTHLSERPKQKTLIAPGANEGGATGALVHCWWERRMVQPLWRTV